MHKDKVLELLLVVEKQVVSILLANDLAVLKKEKKDYKFSNLELTNFGRRKLSQEKPEISSETLTQFRLAFPPGFRSSEAEVLLKMQRFLQENPEVTEEDVIEMAKKHNSVTDPPFCGQAGYFLYKKTRDGVEQSRIKGYLEERSLENPAGRGWNREI